MVILDVLRSLPVESDSHAPLTNSQTLVCSAIAKMTASLATYPHEVVRTRLQIQRLFLSGARDTPSIEPAQKRKPYRGLIDATSRIIKHEGWRGLYKGLSINLFRTVPNSVVTMMT